MHIAIASRKKYQIHADYFSFIGRLVVNDFPSARIIADLINTKRKNTDSNHLITPGLLNAAVLLHDLYDIVITRYFEQENRGALTKLLGVLLDLTHQPVDDLFVDFITHFPPAPVSQGSLSPNEFLTFSIENEKPRELILRQILLLHLSNHNPALQPFKELFSEAHLSQMPLYQAVIEKCSQYFEEQAITGKTGRNLLAFLKVPSISHPENIEEQLDFILKNWDIQDDEMLTTRLLRSRDLIAEDAKLFSPVTGHGGGGIVPVYKKSVEIGEAELLFHHMKKTGPLSIDDVSNSYLPEEERFTDDVAWMPNVVMIAKNTFVWLDQLSKQYQREIRKLDQIPDQELDTLKRWHFTALWLIGIWERCAASKKIKQYCGNHDAVSSAYSLYDYQIANDLGGYPAYQNLKQRCLARGIRLASDMVPNHTGIFSNWILEHPDYYIQSAVPPYPNYSFTGPDLSDDPAVQIRIEDRYYSRNDAAVVFERRDSATGATRYIYHGNDGTNMPWNDTAQLNILIPEVREQLIQQIKHVASLFPIIRFDAAMTLAKKHFQRLWFPQPGTGGAIPSRSDYSLDKNTIDILMPNEFWREVVDRLNAELPDTLLLAEAFWLMEGYFVRTLGMHRVYNSAFMHMFMKEENEKYKALIKNTLEFNPEILKRYVNFMSNPDEETAVNQFGKGDKYIAVCAMMVTLPGLPMFAHGQIEGFTEKYGMEYQRAYYHEQADAYLIARHEREIFPLTQKRYLFSEVHSFCLFDCYGQDGLINENVIAFTNSAGNEKAVVCFNNSYEQAHGALLTSSPKILGDAVSTDNPVFEALPIGEVLDCTRSSQQYEIAYETRTGLHYLFPSMQLHESGFPVNLNGYEYQVYIFYSHRFDHDGKLHRLFASNPGKGYSNIDEAIWAMDTMQLHSSIEELFAINILEQWNKLILPEAEQVRIEPAALHFTHQRLSAVLGELHQLGYLTSSVNKLIDDIAEEFEHFASFVAAMRTWSGTSKMPSVFISGLVQNLTAKQTASFSKMFITFMVINRILRSMVVDKTTSALYHHINLRADIWQILIRITSDYQPAEDEFHLVDLLLSMDGEADIHLDIHRSLKKYFENEAVRQFIGVHEFDGTRYLNKERLILFIEAFFLRDTVSKFPLIVPSMTKKGTPTSSLSKKRSLNKYLRDQIMLVDTLLLHAEEAGYKFDGMLLDLDQRELVVQKQMRKPAFAGKLKSSPAKLRNKGKIKKKR